MHRMAIWERRRLTEGEIALGRILFGDEIDWSSVRVLQAPPLNFGAMAPFGRSIVFSRWRAWRDFAKAPVAEQGWFVHELMHIWQARRGKFLPLAKLKAIGKRAYAYKAGPGLKLRDFNIERQAEIARHLWLARMHANAAEAPPRDWLEAVWATR